VRNSPPSSGLAALALVVWASAAPSAHRLDEYLQAARLAIEPHRVELVLDLTPGTAVAERVIAEIDRDRDRSISAEEGRAYAQQVVGALVVDIDGRPLRLTLIDNEFPAIDAMMTGIGTVRLRAQASLPALNGGRHHLHYRNTHQPSGSVYLANALMPSNDRVAVTSQHRDVDQRELTIDYTLRGENATLIGGVVMIGIGAALGCLAVIRRRSSIAQAPSH